MSPLRAEAPRSTPEAPQWTEELPGDSHWSGVLRRGMSLSLRARGADANVAALFYNHEQLTERYNMPDTLKAQHTAFLTRGCVCYSDMGRILCSITADTCGWHDTLGGLTDAAQIAELYGATRFQEQRNARYGNGRDAMLDELGKYGLGARDLVANVNFFSRLVADEAGELRWLPSHCAPGAEVVLRFEMDTLVILYAGPHPYQPGGEFAPVGVELTAWYSGPAPRTDACRDRCAENARGFRNTEVMFVA